MRILIGVIIVALLGIGGYYAFSRTECNATVSTSAQAPAHSHNWCSDQKFTDDFCNAEGKCHKHEINLKDNLALPGGAGPHTHALK